MTDSYDLVVIGAGSAGLTAAKFGAQLGLKIALVEKGRVGGDCTWTGCVPSKTLLKVAQVARHMTAAQRFAIEPHQPVFDLKKVMAHVRGVAQRVYDDESPALLLNHNLTMVQGEARFTDSHTIEAGDSILTGKRFLITTGAGPLIPPLPGLEETDYLTYKSVWDLTELPKSLFVLGGGPIGCELAQAFCRLGSKVTLLEGESRILPKDEPEASQVLAQQLKREGMDLRLGNMVEKVSRDPGGFRLVVGGQELTGEKLLLAVGRVADLSGLGLDQAEVEFGPRGIGVDRGLRTSQRHIYAAGDCIHGFQFTHYAGWQGFMAVRNAFLPGSTKGVLDHVPWTTFTDPEVAHAGYTEAEARSKVGDGVIVSHWPMASVDRARTDWDDAGFIKLIYKNNGTILGATVVNARAGEMIQEWSLSIDRGLKIGSVARSVHVYPTYSMANMQLAAQVELDRLLKGKLGAIARGLTRLVRQILPQSDGPASLHQPARLR